MRAIRTMITLALLPAAGGARAGILYVDARAEAGGGGRSWAAAHRSVQAAIDAAGPSDEVWVAAGVYPERIVFPRKHGPMVYGGFDGTEARRDRRDPRRSETVLDAGHRGSVVIARTMMGTLDGFTLRNGTGTPVPRESVYGAPLEIRWKRETMADGSLRSTMLPMEPAKPTGETVLCGGGAYITGRLILRDCIIEDCAAEVGGGVALHGGNGPAVENCVIRMNRAGRGGGLALFGAGMGYAVAANVRACTIELNQATVGGGAYAAAYVLEMEGCTVRLNRATRGGGLMIDNSNASVSANTFSGNTAEVGAGACAESHSGGVLTSNVFTGNNATVEGGGVAVRDQARTALRNNTFTRNTGKRGAALCITSPAGPPILNNLFTRNASGVLYAPVLPREGFKSTAPSLRRNIFFLNGTADETGLGGIIGQAGNRSVDPMLLPDGVHLRPGSPCVDAGDGEGRPVVGRDIDGQARLQGLTVDIGADEWSPLG